MPVTKPKAISAASEATVLTKAVLRAAEHLGMTNKSLATVIGLSEATVSRMRSGDYTLQRGQKSSSLRSCSCAFIDHSTLLLGVIKRSPGRGSRVRTRRSIPNHSL